MGICGERQAMRDVGSPERCSLDECWGAQEVSWWVLPLGALKAVGGVGTGSRGTGALWWPLWGGHGW